MSEFLKKLSPSERRQYDDFMGRADKAMQKKYPKHVGHVIQPLNEVQLATTYQYNFLCMTCGSWEKPVPLTLTLLDVYGG